MSNKSQPYITVTVLTYNGEKYLEELLKAVFGQEIDKSYEVLVIDSGSTDKTLDIIKRFTSVRLHQIPNSEFGHGKTRQLAAEMAKGEVVVYLTHDAVPAHNRWLYEIVKPFAINEKIVGVMGKQIPRPGCFPLLKYEIQHVFSNFGPDFGTTIFYKDDFIQSQGVYDAVGFYSDVNSAAKREFLLHKIPYRDVNYAEDQLFGRDIIENSYYKVYAPRASVVHSNDLLLREYKKRMFDETLALRKTGISTAMLSRRAMYKLIIKGITTDTIRILRDKDFSFKRKAYWLALNPLYCIEKWRGVHHALNIDISDERNTRKHSLEHSRKSE